MLLHKATKTNIKLFQSTNSHVKLFTTFCFATLLLLFSWDKFASHFGKYSLSSINMPSFAVVAHNLIETFRHSWKMTLSSTILTILLFATTNADAQRCNRWNICYEQIQLQENSVLQETVKIINQTLSNQIALLEHEKSNSFICQILFLQN